MATQATAAPLERRRVYVPVRAKFVVAILFALLWLMFSIWFSRRWMEELVDVNHPQFELVAITFIAFVPGFTPSSSPACCSTGGRGAWRSRTILE